METVLKNKTGYYVTKRSNVEFNIKDIDTVGRTVCMVANTLNFFDSQDDILLPGCADKSIAENGPLSNAPDKIQHIMFHDMCRPAGKFKVFDQRVIDGKTVLYGESKLTNSTEGNDAMANYLAGVYNQHSIGLQYVNAEWVQRDAHGNSKKWENLMKECINPEDASMKGQAWVVKELKLFETSTVLFGANKLTETLGIKSENKEAVMFDYLAKIDQLTQILKSGSQSDGMMKAFEIQVLQLKQQMVDIFGKFETKDEKEKQRLLIPKGLDFERMAANFKL